MKSVLFLVDTEPAPAPGDNQLRLTRAFADSGWRVTIEDNRQLHLHPEGIKAANELLSEFDLVWPVGLGPRATFMDRWQLLAHSGARLINSPEVALLLHGKLMWADLMPETHASADADYLVACFETGGEWVAKPAAGSFGRDVQRVRSKESLKKMVDASPGLWLLQRFSEHYAAGEHRTLCAGGRILGSYHRRATDGLRANLAQGAATSPANIQPIEQLVIDEALHRLNSRRVGFASIDTAGPELVEVNVANPGGLNTLELVYGRSFDGDLVEQIEGWLMNATTGAEGIP